MADTRTFEFGVDFHGILTDGAIPVIGGIEAFIAVGYGCFDVTDFLESRASSEER